MDNGSVFMEIERRLSLLEHMSIPVYIMQQEKELVRKLMRTIESMERRIQALEPVE